jgi:hypothetical protein
LEVTNKQLKVTNNLHRVKVLKNQQHLEAKNLAALLQLHHQRIFNNPLNHQQANKYHLQEMESPLFQEVKDLLPVRKVKQVVIKK